MHQDAVQASLQRSSLSASAADSIAGILRAALIGDTEAVSAFLDRGVPVNGRDAGGRTALMEAVFGGQLDTIEALLKRGADLNAQDCDGWTALMEASAKGRADVVSTLLAYGADAKMKNNKGWTALRTTARCNTNVARLLRKAGAD